MDNEKTVTVAHIPHHGSASLTRQIMDILSQGDGFGHIEVVTAEELKTPRDRLVHDEFGMIDKRALELILKSASYEEMMPRVKREPRIKDWEQRERPRPRRKNR